MPASISYLSTTVTIGHQTVHLKTDTLPSAGDAADAASGAIAALNAQIQQGVTFRTDPGQTISFTPGDLESWIKSLGSAFTNFGFPDLSGVLPTGAVLNDLTVEIRNLAVSTNGAISFNMRLTLSESFATDLGIPAEVSGLFGAASIGFGFSYSS